MIEYNGEQPIYRFIRKPKKKRKDKDESVYEKLA